MYLITDRLLIKTKLCQSSANSQDNWRFLDLTCSGSHASDSSGRLEVHFFVEATLYT